MDGEESKAVHPFTVPGYWRRHVHKGDVGNTGSPMAWCRDNQPDAREGQAGRYGVAERPVVLEKPGNAGGGKGPWFKTDATSRKGREIG